MERKLELLIKKYLKSLKTATILKTIAISLVKKTDCDAKISKAERKNLNININKYKH